MNPEQSLTPLQVAQRELISVGVSSNPGLNANSAQINGLLMSARLNALVAMVGMGSPEFEKLFEAECLAQVLKLTDQIKAINATPKLVLAN
jgi:hypothetical protein